MGRCCVPQCRGNYDTGPKVRVFNFPRDEARRALWLKAVPRDDLETLRDPKVCELHFRPEQLRTTTSYVYADGRKIEANMGLTRLAKDAVPSLLLHCRPHLQLSMPRRKDPDRKQKRQEAYALKKALALQLKRRRDHQMRQERKYVVVDFKEFVGKLPFIKIEAYWTTVQTETCIMFVHIEATSAAPEIRHSITVSHDLSVRAYWKTAKLVSDQDIKIPGKLHDLRALSVLLDSLQNFKPEETCPQEGIKVSFKRTFSLVKDILKEGLIPKEKLEALKFLKEQVQLVFQETSAARYSADILIFASILHIISPHAYRFVQGSAKLILPDPSTVAHVCGCHVESSFKKQQEERFLNYTKSRANQLRPEDRKVALTMCVIHIHQFLKCKRESVTGAAPNSTSVPRTLHVFMTQSLQSSHKDVVQILPVHRNDPHHLHQVLRRVIIEMEQAGLFVVAVVSDNSAINRKTMSLFSPTQTLGIVFPHPADSTRPLFYVIDPAYLLKCVCNNWLNQENPEKCIFYPKFNSVYTDMKIDQASFVTLQLLHASEQLSLFKFGCGLPFTVVNPCNLESQSVSLSLEVFNSIVAEAIRTHGEALNLRYIAGTSNFIELILRWWKIVTVKSASKSRSHPDANQQPIHSITSPQLEFLAMFVDWLEVWRKQKQNTDTGFLADETHSALQLTTYALTEVCRYCIEELGFSCVLLGKFQTDCLDERFGKYRHLAGS